MSSRSSLATLDGMLQLPTEGAVPAFDMEPSLVNTANGIMSTENNSSRGTTPPSDTMQAFGETQNYESTSNPTLSTLRRPLTKEELEARDRKAVAYTLALLESGDTLVHIKYPGNSLLYDPTGFQLTSKAHRVHSQKLLATGSQKFRDLLLDDWKQHRMRKAKGYRNKEALPPGIEYILDLTPPDEGDEAVELISDLSCSPGIRHWYLAEQRCGVHRSLVGGKDEVAKSTIEQETDNEIANVFAPSMFRASSETQTTTSTEGQNPQSIIPASSEQERQNETNLQRVLKRSMDEAIAAPKAHMQFDPDAKDRLLKVEEIQEYCPIRHRAGIERLLQVIEGKDPRLDSAPKVWTLFAIAKYFNCTEVVRDFIVSWMLADPNCQIIEILPEISYKIGNGLRSSLIARPAFAILVSEEAMSIASRIEGNKYADSQGTNQFLRVKEDIDENSLDAIQAAAHEFQSRIQAVLDDLIDSQMLWFETLPEFSKLRKFRARCKPEEEEKTESLLSHLRNYVRGRLLAVFTAELPLRMRNEANENRRAEQYLKRFNGDFANIWNTLRPRERVMTKFFWQLVRELMWSADDPRLNSIELFDCCGGHREDMNFQLIKDHGVQHMTLKRIRSARDGFNMSVLDAIKNDAYNDGNFPKECFWGWEQEAEEIAAKNTYSIPWSPQLRQRNPYPGCTMESASDMPEGGPATKRLDNHNNRLPSIYPEYASATEGGIKLEQPDEDKPYLPSFLSKLKPFPIFGQPSSSSFVPSSAREASKLALPDETTSSLAPAPMHNDRLGGPPLRDFDLPDRSRPSSRPSNEIPLLQKEPNRPRILGKKATLDSPTLGTSEKFHAGPYDYAFDEDLSELDKVESDNYASGIFDEDLSAFEKDLLGNLNSNSGKVVVAPMTAQESSKENSPQQYLSGLTGLLSGTINFSPAIEPIKPLPPTLQRNLRDSASAETRSSKPHNVPTNSPIERKIEALDSKVYNNPTFTSAKRKSISSRYPKSSEPVIPSDDNINPDSPFFSTEQFFVEVCNYVRSTSIGLLWNGEVDFRTLTDTLLCLTDNEYKYLPLWAGGNEDGTGGVFSPDMPPALHGGPSGPGPSYHTGSTVNSRASTEVEWDGNSSVDTSIAVENGYSDHIDRRVVASDDGFGGSSIAFSVDSEDYGAGDIKGKAKAVEDKPATPSTGPVSVSKSISMDLDDDDFMNVSEGEEDWDTE